MNNEKYIKTYGFTIVELLIVIVIIGILATITIVSYRGITQKAVETSLASDLSNASTKLKMFQAEHGVYPATIDCEQPDSNTNVCIKLSSENTIAEYTFDNSTKDKKFQLSVGHKDNVVYRVNDKSSPIACPLGFVIVPGSKTYGTNDFCVMKYEARQVDTSSVPISTPNGTPWTEIRKTYAVTNSGKVAGCIGCHLISEAEWLTIAQNILMNKSNWSGGAVGSGYIYGGHVFNDPATALASSSDDSDIYFGMGAEGDLRRKRVLELSNGEVIWDFVGNVREWTDGTVSSGFPGVDGGGATWRDWSALTNQGSLPAPNPSPSFAYSGANDWTSNPTFVGRLYSNSDYSQESAYVRGGSWADWHNAGLFSLAFGYASTSRDVAIGFRVAR